jgi:alkaline phosphatase D
MPSFAFVSLSVAILQHNFINMSRTSLLFLILLAYTACKPHPRQEAQGDMPRQDTLVLAFGSCAHQDNDNQRWQAVLAENPDLWIWLGDNIYGDTEDMSLLAEKYEKQKSRPLYQEMRQQMPVYGTWDDHDYGENDAGRHYPKKQESKKLALEFLDVAEDNPVWGREGLYQSYTLDAAGHVKLILLDTRYFRDSLIDNPEPGLPMYLPNPTGDILGEAQWQWLEEQLSDSSAKVNILASSIQVIPKEHGFEHWANFPSARQRLFDLLERTQPKNAIIISGDRHIAEISRMPIPELYDVYEFTSSGLTHTWSEAKNEPNQYRVGDMHVVRNFGIIRITNLNEDPAITFEVHGEEGAVLQTLELYNE